MIMTPLEAGAEETIVSLVLWIKLAIEATGALVIAFGILAAGYRFLNNVFRHSVTNFNEIRLTLARYLALALEFQLGADILSTAVAPSWDQIGKLGAIAIIRTALNYFLTREMHQEDEST
jgi:uncharacterized membrane protein